MILKFLQKSRILKVKELRKTFFRSTNSYFLLWAALTVVGDKTLSSSFISFLTFIKNFNTSRINLFKSFSSVLDVVEFFLTSITLKLFKLAIRKHINSSGRRNERIREKNVEELSLHNFSFGVHNSSVLN